MSDIEPRIDRPTLAWGSFLVLVGALAFVVARLEGDDVSPAERWWPLLLVALGVSRFIAGSDRRHCRSGAWLALLGGWLLINTLGLLGFDWLDSWPLLIIGGGLVDLVWPTRSDDRYDGSAWLASGVWLLLIARGRVDVDWWDAWPLLLVFFGVALLAKAVVQAIPALAGGRKS